MVAGRGASRFGEVPRCPAEIDGNRIALAGVRQAESIVPLAAAKTEPAFMQLLVGSAVGGRQRLFSNAQSAAAMTCGSCYQSRGEC